MVAEGVDLSLEWKREENLDLDFLSAGAGAVMMRGSLGEGWVGAFVGWRTLYEVFKGMVHIRVVGNFDVVVVE